MLASGFFHFSAYIFMWPFPTFLLCHKHLTKYRVETYFYPTKVKNKNGKSVNDYGHLLSNFHGRTDKEAVITINANFFEQDSGLEFIVGEMIMGGERSSFYAAKNKPGIIEKPYFLGIEDDDNGNQRFSIGEMQLYLPGDKKNTYYNSYLFPPNSFEWALGNIGGLIREGKIVNEKPGKYFSGSRREDANRTVFGFNKDQTKAFIFIGLDNKPDEPDWFQEFIADFLLEKSKNDELNPYNAIYLDGGGSTGLLYRKQTFVYTDRPVPSVLQVFEK